MTATLDSISAPPREAEAPPAPRRRTWMWGVIGVGALALFLSGWQVWAGAPSEYYASIALSMSRSWSNFFFGAVDPAGTVTLDKIPGSFWIPALFVRVFGYSAWTVILPNALAATAAALITAVTARRLAGIRAGLLAGAIVAVTPILVAVSRSNQPESFFVLGLSLTAWASVRAVQTKSVGWLVAAGAFIGLSFQFYMLEAWAVWPALAAAYLCTRQAWGRRLVHLVVAGAVSLATSLWWVAIVSLIPSGSRPYIGSTIGDNPWEMVFGYNGLGRFGATADSTTYESFTPPFSGDPGILRLFNAQLAGQIAWLIPAALIGIVVLWILRFPRPLTVLLTIWTLTFAAMFSTVAGMHQFYTAALAVPLALVVAVALTAAHRTGTVWPQIAIVGVAGLTAVIVGFSYGGYSVPVSLAQAAAAAAAIVLLLSRHRARVITAVAMIVGLLLTPTVWSAVTIAHPSSINPVAGGVSEMSAGGFGGTGRGPGGQGTGTRTDGGSFPGGAQAGGRGGGQSGPRSGFAPGGSGTAPGSGRNGTMPGAGGRQGMTQGADSELVAWLEARDTGSTYVAATFGAQQAASLILATDGASILPIGGFNGSDDVPTLDRFISLVQSGELRYVIGGEDRGAGGGATGFGGTGFGGTGSAAGGGAAGSARSASSDTASAQIRQWVEQNCTVDASAPGTVYDCG
ncbi:MULTISPECIES: glycosyltransferase family 39 protein [Microbacterium]|uniref:glycosyltransferase family 39 protein n=1 Tax=Microbacterium TaxID=33882 RepID=UPI0027865401|nr:MULTISPECIES: glycosyltransferase family 39 protein [Microbacterium]MDQ1077291.1 4-amino-4-deoxy-L-arabinose transferase-like glycosyltransferase [Microbacterium sp. SORGH_AS_0969]MDQ1117535.1 4-amino-4-deoxy-L-arabinose transferase-like glycosyltransferase [Microbacterium testaceum]